MLHVAVEHVLQQSSIVKPGVSLLPIGGRDARLRLHEALPGAQALLDTLLRVESISPMTGEKPSSKSSGLLSQ